MTLVPLVIAPFITGLDKEVQPWLAPIDSFSVADNVSIRRGVIEKRGGYILMAQLSNKLRVMGLLRYIEANGAKSTLAFDTKSAYIYSSTTSSFNILDSSPIFDGGEFDYVVGCNWQSSALINRLYFTNGLPYENNVNGIRYYQASNPTVTTLFTPTTGQNNTLSGCKLLFTLGSRLIALSCYENDGKGTKYFPQRARWCAKQNPQNWNDTIAGGGDFADAATGDHIVSAQLYQNNLMVFFTNSIWLLTPTADPQKAFRWIQINSYRACNGKMATLAYDLGIKALGKRGITQTHAQTTERIDQKIPDFVVEEINGEYFEKVYALRNYEAFQSWILYPSGNSTENNKVLLYDDLSQGFTTYSLALNCIGYGTTYHDLSFSDFTAENNLDFAFDQMGEATFSSYAFDERQDILLGGDLNGNIYELEYGETDNGQEIVCELMSAAWNPFKEEGVECLFSYIDILVDTDQNTRGKISFYKNDFFNPYLTQNISFLPQMNYVSSIINITKSNPCIVTSPNHGLKNNDIIYIYGVEGMTQINGTKQEIEVLTEDVIILKNESSTDYSSYIQGGEIYKNPFVKTKTWLRAYCGGIGYSHRIKLEIRGGSMRIHAFKPYFKKRGKRTVNV